MNDLCEYAAMNFLIVKYSDLFRSVRRGKKYWLKKFGCALSWPEENLSFYLVECNVP